MLSRIRRGERIEHYETIRQRKNGEQFPVSLTVSPILDAGGRVMGASKIVLREYRIGLCSEVAVRKEQQLDSLPQLILYRVGRSNERFYVRHIDLSRNLAYRSGASWIITLYASVPASHLDGLVLRSAQGKNYVHDPLRRSRRLHLV